MVLGGCFPFGTFHFFHFVNCYFPSKVCATWDSLEFAALTLESILSYFILPTTL